jgi:hypothetical protein
LGNNTDKTIDEESANIIMPNETKDEIWIPKMPENILAPINNKIKAKPFCK